MQRRQFVQNITAMAALLGVAPASLMAAFQNTPAWKLQMIADNAGIFTERGGTILFVATKEGLIVVDSQFKEQSQHFIEAITKQQPDQPFVKLVNTHHHLDHTGGNMAFKGMVPHVLAHENSKINQQAVAVARKIEDQQLYPTQTYSNKWCEKFGKEEMCLHHFGAAHTNGDSLVYFKQANIAHMGDLVFNRLYPNIDKSAGASIQNWIPLLEKCYALLNKKTKIVCGHALQPEGVVTQRETLLEMRNYLSNLLDFTAKQIAAGKTKEQLLENTTIPGYDSFTDQYKFIKVNLSAAYDELVASK